MARIRAQSAVKNELPRSRAARYQIVETHTERS